jgi:hypothetical protein
VIRACLSDIFPVAGWLLMLEGECSMGKPVLGVSMDRATLPCFYCSTFPSELNQSYVYTQIPARVRVNNKQYINRLLQISNIHQHHTAHRITRSKAKQTIVRYYAIGGRKYMPCPKSAICIGINQSSKQSGTRSTTIPLVRYALPLMLSRGSWLTRSLSHNHKTK